MLFAGVLSAAQSASKSQPDKEQQPGPRNSHQSASDDVSLGEQAELPPHQTPVNISVGQTSCKAASESQVTSVKRAVDGADSASAAAAAAGTRQVPKANHSVQADLPSTLEPALTAKEAGDASSPEAAVTSPRHAVSMSKDASSDRTSVTLANSEMSKALKTSSNTGKAVRDVKLPLTTSPKTASGDLSRHQTGASRPQNETSAAPGKHASAASAELRCTPHGVHAQPGCRSGVGQSEALLMVRRLPAVLISSLPTAESLGLQLSMPNKSDMLREWFSSPCMFRKNLVE